MSRDVLEYCIDPLQDLCPVDDHPVGGRAVCAGHLCQGWCLGKSGLARQRRRESGRLRAAAGVCHGSREARARQGQDLLARDAGPCHLQLHILPPRRRL